jgi:hypothetical protein
MVSYNLAVVGLFAKQMQSFEHPAVDSSRTEIVPHSIGDNGKICVGVNLYDDSGNLLFEDQEVDSNSSLPGMLVNIDLSGRLGIENAYIKEEYSGQRIGTGFISDLMETARKFGFESISLVADKDTGAKTYWTEKHGFVSVDGSLRLEKKL